MTNTSTGAITIPDRTNSHYYQINTDGTFERVAADNGTPEELKGFYTLSDESIFYGNEDNSIQKFIELTYSSETAFPSCNDLDGKKQLLILLSNNILQNTLGGACDGIDYEYAKETD